MRIPIDPLPLVLGIYAHVGELLDRSARRREEGDAEALAKRFVRQRQSADREVRQLVRSLQSDVKTADKLLKKTADIWKISQETDLVDLVVHSRDGDADPKVYVLLKPEEVKALLRSIASAARGSGEAADVVALLESAAEELQARRGDYLTFGFDPWGTT